MPGGISAVDVLVDRWNVLHVLWEDMVVDQWEIYYVRWNGEAWSAVTELSNNWGYSYRPTFALDSHDMIHAVWTDTEPFFPGEGIVYCYQPADDPLPPYLPTPTATPPHTATPTVTPTGTFTPTPEPTATETPSPTPTELPAPGHRIYLPVVLKG